MRVVDPNRTFVTCRAAVGQTFVGERRSSSS
jgi:hypothetical protein